MALEESSVPVAFILNETDDLAQIEEGMDLGFNAVMVESDYLQPDEYLQLVKKVVRQAHAQGVSVEAQIGRLPQGSEYETGRAEGRSEQVRTFVEETGIDALGDRDRQHPYFNARKGQHRFGPFAESSRRGRCPPGDPRGHELPSPVCASGH